MGSVCEIRWDVVVVGFLFFSAIYFAFLLHGGGFFQTRVDDPRELCKLLKHATTPSCFPHKKHAKTSFFQKKKNRQTGSSFTLSERVFTHTPLNVGVARARFSRIICVRRQLAVNFSTPGILAEEAGVKVGGEQKFRLGKKRRIRQLCNCYTV